MRKGIITYTAIAGSRLILWITLLLSICSCEENLEPANNSAAVYFNSPGVTAKTESATITRALIPENLAAGATVRVLAYKRLGTSPDIATDTYEGENTYVVDASGNLSACVTDANGVVTAGTPAELYLRDDTYDFYAVTPALAVTGGVVSVDNGLDYAVSFTGAVPLTLSGSRTVTLSTLERKCSLLSFSVTRKVDNIASITVDQLSLSYTTRGALNADITGDIDLTGALVDYPLVLGSSAFRLGEEAYQKYAGSVVLPKASSGFRLEFKLYFNAASTVSTLTADVPAMVFEKGMRYNFSLVLRGESALLTLYLSDAWSIPVDWNTDSGNGVGVVVGQWTSVSWQTTGGAIGIVAGAGSWQVNPNWQTELSAAQWAVASGSWNPTTGGTTDSGSGGTNTGGGSWGTNTGKDSINNGGTGTAPGDWTPTNGGSTNGGGSGTTSGGGSWGSSDGGSTDSGNGTGTGTGSWTPTTGGSTEGGSSGTTTGAGSWGTNTGNDSTSNGGTGTAPGNWTPTTGGSTNGGSSGATTGAGSWNSSGWNTDFN